MRRDNQDIRRLCATCSSCADGAEGQSWTWIKRELSQCRVVEELYLVLLLMWLNMRTVMGVGEDFAGGGGDGTVMQQLMNLAIAEEGVCAGCSRRTQALWLGFHLSRNHMLLLISLGHASLCEVAKHTSLITATVRNEILCHQTRRRRRYRGIGRSQEMASKS